MDVAVTAVLGVDPTATGSGAAVLRVDGGVVAWWAWTWSRDRRVWRLRTADGDRDAETVEAVGELVGHESAGADVVVEGLHGPPRWKQRTGRGASAKDLITLAEATGRTIAGLARYCGEPIARPTWKEWTAPFGLSGLKSEAAERAVLEMAMREGWLPRGLTIAEQVAVGECGLISRWGEK